MINVVMAAVTRVHKQRIRLHLAGLSVTLGVGVVIVLLEHLVHPRLPFPLLALTVGMLIGRVLSPHVEPGAKVAATHCLQIGIVLLGVQLSFQQVREVGSETIILILTCLIVGAGIAFWIAQAFGVSLRVSILLAAGTAICGNSAIIAVAPGIGADEEEVAASIAAVTLYGTAAVFLFPFIGEILGMPVQDFATWAGTAINDTSQVVAAAFSVSDQAGETATIVKLARNLAIVPAAVISPLLVRRSQERPTRLTRVFPWFVFAFLMVVISTSVIEVPKSVAYPMSLVSRALILAALTGIGVRAGSIRLAKSVVLPLIVGSTAGILLAVVSLLCIQLGVAK